MSATGPSARRILRGLAGGAAVVAPLALLLDPHVAFARDWPIHLWIIDYFGEYFRQHGDIATVFHLAPAAGVALPVFYAWLFYPALGLLAAVLGAAMAVRVALGLMVAIQFYALLSAGRRILQHPRLAYTVAVSVIWATYSLTNLYSRGALAEYFGTGFFVTALAFATSAAVATCGASRWFNAWLAGLFLVLAMGVHPPTAVLAAAFLALLGLGWAIGAWRVRRKVSAGDWRRLAAGGVLAALILSPWIYVNASLSHQLSIASDAAAFRFRPDHCDTFWGRFAPFPYDAASTESGTATMGTPYLEAPVNMVLLGILLWNLELGRRLRRASPPGAGDVASSPARELLVVAAGWFVFLAALSISPWLAGWFHIFAPYIQYVYRLVSHCNAALLVAVFASGWLVARHAGYRRYGHQTELVLVLGLAVAVLGLWIKLQHSAVVAVPDGTPAHSLTGAQLEIAGAYDTPGLVRSLTSAETRDAAKLSFPVGRAGPDFGEIAGVAIELKRETWLRTNLMVFPWMQVTSDGQALRADQLARSGHFLALHLAAGRHELRPIWQPDRTWLILRRLSLATFALVGLATLAWAAARLFARRALTADAGRAPA